MINSVIFKQTFKYIIFRFYDKLNGHILSTFWELHDVFDMSNDKQSTAEHLFHCLIETLNHTNILLDNIIGFDSGSCNIMMEFNNSLATRFLQICLGIFILKCICHSTSVCVYNVCIILILWIFIYKFIFLLCIIINCITSLNRCVSISLNSDEYTSYLLLIMKIQFNFLTK